MTASEKYNLVKQACKELRVCEVNFKDERHPRKITPFGICLTFKRGLVIVCCIMEEYIDCEGPEQPLTNLPIEDCHHIKILDIHFQNLPDIARRSEICDDWLFHI